MSWYRDGNGLIHPGPDGRFPDGSKIVRRGEGWALMAPHPDGGEFQVRAVPGWHQHHELTVYARQSSETHLGSQRPRQEAEQRIAEAQAALDAGPVPHAAGRYIVLNPEWNVWQLVERAAPGGTTWLVAESADIAGLSALTGLPEAAEATLVSPRVTGPGHSTAERMGWTDGVELRQVAEHSWVLQSGAGPMQAFESRAHAETFAAQAGADINAAYDVAGHRLDPPDAATAEITPSVPGHDPTGAQLDPPGPTSGSGTEDQAQAQADLDGPIGFGPAAPDASAELLLARGIDPSLPAESINASLDALEPAASAADRPNLALQADIHMSVVAPEHEAYVAAKIAGRTFPDVAAAIERAVAAAPPMSPKPTPKKVLQKVLRRRR